MKMQAGSEENYSPNLCCYENKQIYFYIINNSYLHLFIFFSILCRTYESPLLDKPEIGEK